MILQGYCPIYRVSFHPWYISKYVWSKCDYCATFLILNLSVNCSLWLKFCLKIIRKLMMVIYINYQWDMWKFHGWLYSARWVSSAFLMIFQILNHNFAISTRKKSLLQIIEYYSTLQLLNVNILRWPSIWKKQLYLKDLDRCIMNYAENNKGTIQIYLLIVRRGEKA